LRSSCQHAAISTASDPGAPSVVSSHLLAPWPSRRYLTWLPQCASHLVFAILLVSIQESKTSDPCALSKSLVGPRPWHWSLTCLPPCPSLFVFDILLVSMQKCRNISERAPRARATYQPCCYICSAHIMSALMNLLSQPCWMHIRALLTRPWQSSQASEESGFWQWSCLRKQKQCEHGCEY